MQELVDASTVVQPGASSDVRIEDHRLVREQAMSPLQRENHAPAPENALYDTVSEGGSIGALYDSTGLSNFSNLRISDPQPNYTDHIYPAASSMSRRLMHSFQAPNIAGNHRMPDHDHGHTPYDLHGPEFGRVNRSQLPHYSESAEHFDGPSTAGIYSQRSWQNTLDYNPLYAAASSVLGMAPPVDPASLVGAAPAPPDPPMYSGLPIPKFRQQTISTNAHSLNSLPPPIHTSELEIEPRPSMLRGGTSTSVSPNSQKSKAVDLTAPPYTKEYIDQYRQRIKSDPDPEAHFLYSKYLIDAAKHIRATAKDQRAGKKYSEILIAESLKVVRRLATQGDTYDEAQFFLANCYGTGALGLQVDHERAYHLYLQAAKQNHAAATYRVAVCNEIGAGTRREPPRAAAFYRKAASLGDTAAMYKLGMILLHGSLGEQRNPREATNWLKRAAEQADEENPHALHELGLLYEQPDSQLVPYDPAYAKNLFTQAAQLGYTPSQYKLGQCYEYGILTSAVDPRRSIAWYTKAAEKGDAEAELALSGWYLTGSEGVLKQSDSEAYLWARRAANKGLSKAEYAVGYYAEVGIGIKQDVEFAKRWYMRAAAQGNKRAMNRLTELKRMGNKRSNVVRPTRQEAKDECQSRTDAGEKVFHNETPISFSQDVVNHLSDRLQSSDVLQERQLSLDAHVRSRIQAELDHLRKEEEHVRQEIESALEKENLDRERATTGVPDNDTTIGAPRSSTVLSEDLEQIRFKIERFHARKRLDMFPHAQTASESVLACYRLNQGTPLDCWQEVRSFKNAIAAVEQEYLKTV
ncbi:hypothetical protein APHAL10511_001376 [Amanita phalloides]|nr:hypothetical protein APHAL10511_001376 [Amanita phalloides]